eukprot:CAMPEP_0197014852 /NCGR_PEP_ID=MMETSP1380-20130617/71946_1 /TAXON_ID=5936 /ORGANISM="Euplotes crassus, Strain CT5" /LENGTH=122 /DNA_ID=CAMNT_0042440299 /DNA_START=162 /DNA_END=527 /DNA_ORIENTATION=+
MMLQKLKEIKTSPHEGDRLLEDTLRKIKERAINRTVKLSSEIKQTSEWTMGKVLHKVIKERKREKERIRKEHERKKEEKELRHQLETQSIVSNLSKWLTQKASEMIKQGKENGLLSNLNAKK